MADLSGLTVLNSRSGTWFKATKIRYGTEFTRPSHHHAESCIQVVLDGSFSEVGWRRERLFETGEALLRPAGFDHANPQSGDPSVGLSIQVRDAGVPLELESIIERIDPVCARDPYVASLAQRIVGELTSPDELSGAAIEGLCTEALVRMIRRAERERRRSGESKLVESAEAIVRHGLARKLTVDVLAQELGVDRFALNRAFLKHRGFPPSNYIRQCRIERAQRLLIETSRPLVAIAAECGFTDQSHMTKAFVASLGITPQRFRVHHDG